LQRTAVLRYNITKKFQGVIIIFCNKNDVENFIYSSYIRAAKSIPAGLPDKETRNPAFTKKLLRMLDNPDAKQRNILITGSKGKGSVSRMLSKLLEVHGYKVGLFTSPHLVNFNERIRINGKAISDDDLIKYSEIIKPYFNEIEIGLPENIYIGPVGTTAVISMLYFQDNNTDFNVIECGKGARYDDVCMLESEMSVINSIFLEHIPELGSNINEIAFNKAGIIKKTQSGVFTANQQECVLNIIKEVANELNVDVKVYGKDFSSRNIAVTNKGTEFDIETEMCVYKGIKLSLLGRHQANNAALAVKVAENLLGNLDLDLVKACFEKLTWPGRLEIINNTPLTVLDGCINRESAKYVKEVIKETGENKIIFIIGIPDDKDYVGVIAEFNEIAEKIILTKTKNQYLKFTEEQLLNAQKMAGDKYLFCKDVNDSINKAYGILDDNGAVFILGTQSLIRETKEYFNQDTTNLD
jgi:dihydrofolate synthase / folylpolyglutamate synthase